MSPNTKKLLTYGVPIAAAVIGLIVILKGKKSTSTAAAATGTVASVTPSGEVQASQEELATYESYTQQQLAALTSQLKTALDGTGAGPIPTTQPTSKPQPVAAAPHRPRRPLPHRPPPPPPSTRAAGWRPAHGPRRHTATSASTQAQPPAPPSARA